MVCPAICPPLVLGGSIFSKYFGLDDMIFGLWLGALIMIFFIILIKWLDKKRIKFLFRKPIIFFSLFVVNLYPLYYFNILEYHPYIWFFDKIMIGNLFGVLVIISSEMFNDYLLKKNNGKVLFKFQKIIIPMVFIILITLIIYFSLKFNILI
ncbi:MAG: hypothetical protein QXS69_02760 [Candidatus Aenigmatarchaeota archaeon]